MAEDDYALVVGISKYPALGDLDGPENDARDFTQWLLDPAGGNVPKDHVKTILSSDYPQPPLSAIKAQPQTTAISEILDDFALQALSKGQVGRRLYLYLAGHGFAPSIEDAALLMANAAKGIAGYNISGRPYANWFRQAGAFEEIVLFMDCCREVAMLAKANHPPYDPLNAVTPGERYYVFATQWSRASREGPWGEGGEKRGIFTLALMSGLRGGAERDANGQVTGVALENYVINYLRNDERAFKKEDERPDPEFDFKHAGYTFLFNAPPGEPPQNPVAFGLEAAAAPAPPTMYRVKLTVAAPNGHQFTLESGTGQVFDPMMKSAQEWQWEVPDPGLYKIRRDDGKTEIAEVIGGKDTTDVSI